MNKIPSESESDGFLITARIDSLIGSVMGDETFSCTQIQTLEAVSNNFR